jgi:hypothetical protein
MHLPSLALRGVCAVSRIGDAGDSGGPCLRCTISALIGLVLGALLLVGLVRLAREALRSRSSGVGAAG